MKTQNIEFSEALDLLATQAGVTLSKRSGDAPSKSERALQLEIMESALSFFRDQLSSSPVAKSYLTNRSIDQPAIDEWELGYAPDVGEALAVFLQKKGYSLSLCRTLFLVEEDSSGGYFDKFRGRLMFPIRDERGALVAFGGRVLGDGLPKYINSSDTPLYRKSRVLYGMNRATGAIAKMKPRQGVLCEGYLDVIACHRAGVKGAVASLGTALSEDHAKLLGRWCDEIVILYDADSAGQKAAERALEVLKQEKASVRVALMPNGEDPDTLLRKEGPAAVVDAVKNAALPTTFRLDQIIASHSEKGQAFWAEVVEVLAQAPDIPEYERHAERLVSMYAGVRDQLFVREEIRKQVLALWEVNHPDSRVMVKRLKATETLNLSVTSLHPTESALIAALTTPGLRVIAHEALVLPELMTSESGRTFSTRYAEVFGEEAPNGEPSIWISRLDNQMQDLIHRCASDSRFANLDDRYVKDSILRLQNLLEKRQLQFVKQKEDPGRVAKIRETLERLKKRDR